MGEITFDSLAKQIADLTALVQAHKNDPATLDRDAVEAVVKDVLRQSQLLRRGAPNPTDYVVGADGQIVRDPIVQEGKFAGLRQSDLQFVNAFLKRAHVFSPATVRLPSEALVKALTSTGVGTGDELVPTGMAAELWQDFFLASMVVGNLSRVAMPTDPFDDPLGLGDVTWRKGTQNTATTASDTATAKSTFTSTELVAEVNWSYTLDEDAVIAVLPALRDRLRISGAEAMDAFALNADATNATTGNINLDDADPADDSYYLSAGQDGIRHQWLVDNVTQGVNAGGDALTDLDVVSMLVKMGKYAVSPAACCYITDVATYLKGFLSLDGVQTLEKYGSSAVLLTGELGRYRGIPIVVSASAPKTEADGKCSVTAGNNTLGQISCINRRQWRVGFRRELLMEVDRDIQKRMFILVVSFRIALACHTARASATHTAGIYNILVA